MLTFIATLLALAASIFGEADCARSTRPNESCDRTVRLDQLWAGHDDTAAVPRITLPRD